jgi:hypothetical protein
MKRTECREEAAVRRAAAAGAREEALVLHADLCEPCGEVARIAAALGALARAEDAGGELPDPAVLWRKACLLEALEARRSATRPIQLASTISLATGAAALAALVGLKAPSFFDWIGTWAEQGPGGATVPLTVLLFAFGAVLFVLSVAATGRNLSRSLRGNVE